MHLNSALDDQVRAGRPARMYARRRALAIAFAILFVWVVYIAFRPVPVVVGEQQVAVSQRATVAEALASQGITAPAGDFVDVHGRTLRAGAGKAPRHIRNGLPVSPDTRIKPGDRLAVLPGENVMEAYSERATVVPCWGVASGTPLGRVNSPVAGSRRVWRGTTSGAVRVAMATSTPVIASEKSRVQPKRLALTFDDGPYPQYTPRLLDILKKHNARATFFVLGSLARSHPHIITRIVNEGHEIGCHSWHHANYTRLSAEAIHNDLARWEAAVNPLIGGPARWMRPPYGAINSTARAVITQRGYRVALWTGDTGDWRKPGAAVISNRILSAARDGAVILCHDGGGERSGTLKGVKMALPQLQARGYQMVTMSQLQGLEPLVESAVLVTEAGEPLTIKPATELKRVLVDEKEAALPQGALESAGQLLLPAKPLLDMLGVVSYWDQQTLSMTLITVRGRMVVRVNSAEVEYADGVREALAVPPVIHNGRLMLPLWLLTDISGARAHFDPFDGTLRLITPAAPEKLPQGRLSPASQHVRSQHWRTQLQVPFS